MITAGDELGRTQQGNNNAYCQDSPLSWVHWDTGEAWSDQIDLTGKLLQLRAERPVLRREDYLDGDFLLDAKGEPQGRRNIAWFGGQNVEMTEQDWRDPTRRTLGMYLAYDDPYRVTDEAFLLWFHAGSDPIQVELPDGPWADTYTVIAHTGNEGELPSEKITAGSTLQLPGRTVVVLQVD
jgi:glycogen operon protein